VALVLCDVQLDPFGGLCLPPAGGLEVIADRSPFVRASAAPIMTIVVFPNRAGRSRASLPSVSLITLDPIAKPLNP